MPQTLETSSEMVAFSLDQISPGRAEPAETLPVMFSLAQPWCLGVAQEATGSEISTWDVKWALSLLSKYLTDLIFLFSLFILCLNF